MVVVFISLNVCVMVVSHSWNFLSSCFIEWECVVPRVLAVMLSPTPSTNLLRAHSTHSVNNVKSFTIAKKCFRPMRDEARQIQPIIATLEDVKFANKDIYLTYINHPRLLAIMEDCGDPL